MRNYFTSFAFVAFSIYAFLNAGLDFSYDYSAYLYYLGNILSLDVRYIAANFFYNLPQPYVLIPPYAYFEPGFTLLAFTLGTLGMAPAVIYALIGTTSIAIRAYAFQKMQVPAIQNFLLSIIFITLFEANALRVGIASSTLLLALILFISRRYALSAILAAISFTLHIQSFIYAFMFLAGLSAYVFSLRRPDLTTLYIALSFLGIFIILPYIFIPLGTKIDDYLVKTSGATGLNAISVMSVVLIYLATRSYLESFSSSFSMRDAIKFSTLLAFTTSTAFVIFGSSLSDIGVRLWQFAFLIFATVFSSSKFVNPAADSGKNKYTSYLMKFMILFCIINVINVIIRYPLSNFFYPIIPRAEIDYLIF